MFQGVNSLIVNHEMKPISDIGGRRILGMGGSLSGYINTGNQYHKDYYSGSKKKNSKKPDFKDKINKYLKPIVTTAAVCAASVLAYKAGGKKLFPKLFKKTENNSSAKKVALLSKAKSKISSLTSGTKNNKINFFDKLKNKFHTTK